MPGKDSRVRRPSLNVKPTAAWWPWESPTPPQSGSEAHMKQAFPQPSQRGAIYFPKELTTSTREVDNKHPRERKCLSCLILLFLHFI